MCQFNKVSLRLVNEKTCEYNPTIIRTQADVVKFIDDLEDIRNHTEERVYCIAMNTKNEIIGFSQIAQGNINNCNFDVKGLFKTILLCNASKFILIHNHPSGNPAPSNEDIAMTKMIFSALSGIGIQLYDHIIVGDERAYSMARNVYIPSDINNNNQGTEDKST